LFKKIIDTLSINTGQDYLISLIILVIGSLLFRLLIFLIFKILRKSSKLITEKTLQLIQKTVKKIIIPLGYFAILYLSLERLTVGNVLTQIFRYGTIVVFTYFGIRTLNFLVTYFLEKFYEKKENFSREMIGGISLITRGIIWLLGIIFLLDNLGLKVKTLIAGIGIGGIAIALATQKVLADLFSYFAILLDKPFKEGDFLIIDNYLGVVEHIGLKTTRIRSLQGEELIFSNNDLLNSRIKNYITMKERRVLFNLGVEYSTPAEKLKQIPDMIKAIINGIEDTKFDRCHFSKYGDFNLIIETVFYIIGADYNKYMDIQQRVNLAIKKKFEEEGIEFAFPTQTIHLQQEEELKQ